jgi:hypothetical protein
MTATDDAQAERSSAASSSGGREKPTTQHQPIQSRAFDFRRPTQFYRDILDSGRRNKSHNSHHPKCPNYFPQ